MARNKLFGRRLCWSSAFSSWRYISQVSRCSITLKYFNSKFYFNIIFDNYLRHICSFLWQVWQVQAHVQGRPAHVVSSDHTLLLWDFLVHWQVKNHTQTPDPRTQNSPMGTLLEYGFHVIPTYSISNVARDMKFAHNYPHVKKVLTT